MTTKPTARWCQTFTAYFRNPHEGAVRKQRVIRIQNAYGCSYTQACSHIFEAGLAAEEENIKTIKVLPHLAAIQKEIAAISERASIQEKLLKIYQQYGLSGFQDWCKGAEVPSDTVDQFLQQYVWSAANDGANWSRRARAWLDAFLLDGEPHRTSEARDSAEEFDIIDSSDQEWKRLCKVAERYGVAGSAYGIWRRTAPNQEVQIEQEVQVEPVEPDLEAPDTQHQDS